MSLIILSENRVLRRQGHLNIYIDSEVSIETDIAH